MIEFLRLQHPTGTKDYIIAGMLTLWLALAGWLAMRFAANYIALVLLPVILFSFVLVIMIRNTDVTAMKLGSLQCVSWRSLYFTGSLDRNGVYVLNL